MSAAPTVQAVDTVTMVEGIGLLPNGYQGPDDWPSVFVPWWWDVLGNFRPMAQMAPFTDWYSPRAGLGFGTVDPLATSAPPQTASVAGSGSVSATLYPVGQTPLWPAWPGIPATAFGILRPYRTVLRSHSNPFPAALPNPDDAWVGLGGPTRAVFSLGVYGLPSPPIPAAAGQPAVVACQLSQVGFMAGSPTSLLGPGPVSVSILWYLVPPGQATTPPNNMTCGNTVAPGTGPGIWMVTLPVLALGGGIQLAATEVLAL